MLWKWYATLSKSTLLSNKLKYSHHLKLSNISVLFANAPVIFALTFPTWLSNIDISAHGVARRFYEKRFQRVQ